MVCLADELVMSYSSYESRVSKANRMVYIQSAQNSAGIQTLLDVSHRLQSRLESNFFRPGVADFG